jgi:colicin import membrane protein
MKRRPPSIPAPSAARHSTEDRDPFPYGWRYVSRRGPDGKEHAVRIALTPEDVLHPQENDEVPQNTLHARDVRYLGSVLECRLSDQPDALVLNDCLIDWGIEGLGNHSPDLSVFTGVRNPKRFRPRLSVAKEGARSLLVIEIVSPDDPKLRNNDAVIKVQEYHRAGVPLYVLIDQEKSDGPRQIIGYRRTVRRYVSLPLDDQGRLLIEPVQVLLGLRDNEAVCWNAATGKEFQDYAAVDRAREAETEGRRAEAQARRAAEAARDAAEAALAAAQARIRALEAKKRRR